MDIAFNINRLAMNGLGITLVSLVRNCSDSKQMCFHFLCSKLSTKCKEDIDTLLSSEGFEGKSKFYDFDADKIFSDLKSLHGDRTCYGRLLLADILDLDKVLYLDSDLLITLDILELAKINLEGYYVGAVKGEPFKASLEHDFYLSLNIPEDAIAFNSGVLYINLQKWRENDFKQKCLDFGIKYSEYLRSADQTILNALIKGQFYPLPHNYNVQWYPGCPQPEVKSGAIFHFVGAPKPWDLFASVIHKGYSISKIYWPKDWKSKYGKITKKEMIRIWNIRKSYLKSLIRKFKR